MTDDSAIRARGITVEAGKKTILDRADIDLRRGSFTAVVGPNGSGKTTLLRALAGIGPPHAGRIEIMGDALRDLPRREIARRLSYVPQNTWTDFDISVRDAVAMGRFAHHAAWSGLTRHDVEAIDEAMARADLVELSDRTLPGLSGGERQRVFLARALAQEAEILVLDEPTSSLDPRHELELVELLLRLNGEGRTVVCAIHDLQVVWRFFTRCIVLDRGRVAAEGDTADVLTRDDTADVFGIDIEAANGMLRCSTRSSRTARA